MSNSTTTHRVKRSTPPRLFYQGRHREAFPYLMEDFQKRCAYSMQHITRAGGPRNMEVDHFNPNHKKDYFQEYSNLFLATGHCNGWKSDRWPTNKDRDLHFRFLDCTKDPDYGVHIFEDPDTHEVVGVTNEGRYHVRNCDLNAPHFIKERTERAAYWETLENTAMTSKVPFPLPPVFDKLFQDLQHVVGEMIPPIPYLSGEALEKRRAKRRERDRILQGSVVHTSAMP